MTRPLTTTLSITRLPLRTGAYWAVTAVVVGEAAIGGAMDLLRMAPFYPVLIDLGYPSYLSTILGTAKVLAAIVIAAPGLPRLKEWAYAGRADQHGRRDGLAPGRARLARQPRRAGRVRRAGPAVLGLAPRQPRL